MTSAHDKDKLALAIWLSGLMKLGPFSNRRMSAFLSLLESWKELDKLSYGDFTERMGIPAKNTPALKDYFLNPGARLKSAKEARRCRRIYNEGGMTAVFFNETAYPKLLKEIGSAPAVLFCSGNKDISLLNKYFPLALIGTRNPTIYGKKCTEKIVAALAAYELVLISGMARGIDSLAHKTALKEDILTVAVLGCGLDLVYPPENKELMQKIWEHGLVISECPPGTKPVRRYFPARNRIISGLSRGVVVTEASKKSGTMITAGFAGDQGRDVFALPGNIDSAFSKGTNSLIRDGAVILTDYKDLKDYYGDEIRLRNLSEDFNLLNTAGQAKSKGNDSKAASPADGPARAIVDLLENSYLTFDELLVQSGSDFGDLANILAVYEINGLIQCENGRYFLT